MKLCDLIPCFLYNCNFNVFNHFQFPSSEEEWKEIAYQFQVKWDFPNCIGAIDGKHINITPPASCGSWYYNYKGSHSIILLAACNANYEFTFVDLGRNGRVSDAGVWGNCSLRSNIENGLCHIPPPVQLSSSNVKLPYVFLADDAFPLSTYMQKPFPFKNQTEDQRIFCYRLSRARRTIENAFGILSSKFRVLKTVINLQPETVVKVVKACLVLHNYIRRQRIGNAADEREGCMTEGTMAQTLRTEDQLLNLQTVPRKASQEAQRIRSLYTNYFVNEGQVPWQRKMCQLE